MNCIYFPCTECKTYVDAGYRWAYWRLQHPGIVRLGEEVSVTAVLEAAEYWNPPEDAHSWLEQEVLPAVRQFFEDHQGHRMCAVKTAQAQDMSRTGHFWTTWTG